MSKKPLIKSMAGGLVFGLFAYLLLPVVLIFVMNVLLSAATVLDPLHARGHLSDVWGRLIAVAVFGTVFSVSVGPTVGAGTAILAARIISGWVYPAVIALSLAAHYLLCILVGGGVYLAAPNTGFDAYLILFALWVLAAGSAMGAICAAVCRSSNRNIEHN